MNKQKRYINFDIAQAIVNYVGRDNDNDSLQWGDLNSTEIRTKLCELRDNNNIDYEKLCIFINRNVTSKMIGYANKKLNRLVYLMKEASNLVKDN